VPVEATSPTGDTVTFTEKLGANDTLEVEESSNVERWGGRLLPTSVGQDEWWVLFYAPELPDSAWAAMAAAFDMRWVTRTSSAVWVSDEPPTPEDMPEPLVGRYRVIAVAETGDQAVAKVRGVVEPYVSEATGWTFEPLEPHMRRR
jgi:hypothetical protein